MCEPWAVNLIPSAAPRRRWFEIVILGLIIPTYLQSRSFFGNGRWLIQRNPRPTLPFFNQLDVTTFPVGLSQSGQCQSSTLTLETTLAMASVFARKMHSTTKFTMTVLSKCVCVCERCVCVSVCPSGQKSTQSSLTTLSGRAAAFAQVIHDFEIRPMG